MTIFLFLPKTTHLTFNRFVLRIVSAPKTYFNHEVGTKQCIFVCCVLLPLQVFEIIKKRSPCTDHEQQHTSFETAPFPFIYPAIDCETTITELKITFLIEYLHCSKSV